MTKPTPASQLLGKTTVPNGLIAEVCTEAVGCRNPEVLATPAMLCQVFACDHTQLGSLHLNHIALQGANHNKSLVGCSVQVLTQLSVTCVVVLHANDSPAEPILQHEPYQML